MVCSDPGNRNLRQGLEGEEVSIKGKFISGNMILAEFSKVGLKAQFQRPHACRIRPGLNNYHNRLRCHSSFPLLPTESLLCIT